MRPALHRNRRALPLVLAAPVLPPKRLPERPVFVIGCPRSGTTVVFSLLRANPAVASIGQEGHRFLDKTPRNSLRLPYLDALFPDAQYVFVQRDGRATVSSLITAWREREHPAYELPIPFHIPGIPDRAWHFILPPGWRAYDGRPLEDVCALQYTTATDAILEHRDGLAAGRFVDVRYEDLLADPAGQMEHVHQALDVPFTDAEARGAREHVRPVGPGREMWRTATPAEIDRVLPAIEPMLERTGYRT